MAEIKETYIYGCGGHAKVILDILYQEKRSVKAFVDDHPPSTITQHHGVPIYSSSEAFSRISPQNSQWIVGIGNNRIRQTIVLRLQEQGYQFTSAIHPSAKIALGVKIGQGTVIMAHVVINVDATIGQHTIINTGAIVEHDCLVNSFAHLAPTTTLCGQVTIGTGVFLGVGTKIKPQLEVGNWTTCGAGSVIIKSLPAFCLAYGCPAQIIQTDYQM